MIERIAIAMLVLAACTNDFPAELLPGESAGCEGLRECLPGLSCCANRRIPGGTFDRSFDVSADGAAQDGFGDVVGWVDRGVAPATLSEFRMDVFEVTVARFRRYVETYTGPPAPDSGAHPRISGSGWQAEWDALLPPDPAALEAQLSSCDDATWLLARDDLPINCVDWYVAFAFCASHGGRLPTEAEWNFVAAGGDEQRAFPWSEPPGDTTQTSDHFVNVEIDDPQGVGSRSALDSGRFAIHDLAGNMREWTRDSALRDYLVPCVDCADLAPSSARVTRGGNYGADALRGRTAYRSEQNATSTSDFVGIRCAR